MRVWGEEGQRPHSNYLWRLLSPLRRILIYLNLVYFASWRPRSSTTARRERDYPVHELFQQGFPSQLNILGYLQWAARTLTLFTYHVAQRNVMLASHLVCTLSVECVLYDSNYDSR